MRYEAKAIGAGSEGAQSNLQEHYNKARRVLTPRPVCLPTFQSMTLAEAERLALSTLKQVMEEKIDGTNVEVAVISAATHKYELYTKEKVEAIIATL